MDFTMVSKLGGFGAARKATSVTLDRTRYTQKCGAWVYAYTCSGAYEVGSELYSYVNLIF